jgi:hypothetical protein
MQHQPTHALQGSVSSAVAPSSSHTPLNSSSRLASVSSAIDGILSTQSYASAPPDSTDVAKQIMAALESAGPFPSPPPAPGAALDTSGDNSPGVFIMRMPPSDRQLKELAARQQQQQQQQQQKKQPSPTKEISSFTFNDVPTLADFDIPAIASDPSLQAM